MPRIFLFAASTLVALGVAACAGGPRAAELPQGLAYDCTPGGEASIIFNGGGYLPESRVWGMEKGERAPVWRSSAELWFGGERRRMIAEWSVDGLRYRSEQPLEGSDYLVWTVRGDGTRGAEDARVGRRAGADAEGDEDRDAGTLVAECWRRGREAAVLAADRQAAPHGDNHGAEAAEETPHGS